MATLRPWVPGPARANARAGVPVGAQTGTRAGVLRPDQVSGRDIAFCAELAAHGGVAASAQGFQAETELLRLQQAGLLDVQRDPAPPFAMIRVELSAAARDLLRAPVQARHEWLPNVAADAPGGEAASQATLGTTRERSLRRNGFEVARGMIGVAVKAELAAWSAGGGRGGIAGLEARVMARLSQIEAPFPA